MLCEVTAIGDGVVFIAVLRKQIDSLDVVFLFSIDKYMAVLNMEERWIGKPNHFVARIRIDLVRIIEFNRIFMAIKSYGFNLISLIDIIDYNDIILEIHVMDIDKKSKSHFPMQNFEKIEFKRSGVVMVPVREVRAEVASRMSMAMKSALAPACIWPRARRSALPAARRSP